MVRAAFLTLVFCECFLFGQKGSCSLLFCFFPGDCGEVDDS